MSHREGLSPHQPPHGSPEVPPVAATAAPEHGHDTHDEQRQHAAGKLGRLASQFVARDFHKDLGHHVVTLRGSKPVDNEKGTDPLTGEETTKNYETIPAIPWTKRKHVELHEYDHRRGHREAKLDHPLYKDIKKGIHENNFSLAVMAAKQINQVARKAADKNVGKLRKGVNNLLPAQMTREAQMRDAYSDLRKGVYRAVTEVEDEPVRDAEGVIKRPVDGDWNSVLDLRNIQSLRSHVYKQWTERSNTKRATDMFEAYIRTGGVMLASEYALAAYLGVDADDLDKQRRHQTYRNDNGEEREFVVVPWTVLNKINFFLQFADNNQPPSGLSRGLAEFSTRRLKGAGDDPMNRVIKALNEHKEESAREAEAALQAQSAPYSPDSTVKEVSVPPAANTNTPPSGNRNPEKGRPNFRTDPTYAKYFETVFLEGLNAQIDENIKAAAENEKDKAGTQGNLSKDRMRFIARAQQKNTLEAAFGPHAPQDLIKALALALNRQDVNTEEGVNRIAGPLPPVPGSPNNDRRFAELPDDAVLNAQQLVDLDKEIHTRVTDEAHARKDARGLAELSKEEFRDLRKSIRQTVIREHYENISPDAMTKIERALYEASIERRKHRQQGA